MRTTLAITEIIQEWLSTIDVKPITANIYRIKINLWFRWIGKKQRQRIATESDVLEYKHHLQESQLSSYTINGYLIVVKLFYKYCEQKNYCSNIAKNIKTNFRLTGKNKLPLTIEQARKLIESCSGNSILEKRNKVIIALMLFNGLRCCEVERMDIRDLSEREDVPIAYLQRKGKDDKMDFVPLHRSVVEYIEDYLSMRDFNEKEPLFISHRLCDRGKILRLDKKRIAAIVKEQLHKIHINDVRISAHSLRHTFGSLLVESGVDMEDVRLLMGHSTTAVTRIYVEVVKQRKMLHNSPANKIINKIIYNNE